MIVESAIVAAISWTAINVSHEFADHILQTDYQAENKAKPGRVGWAAMLQHIFSYHVSMIIALLTVIALFDLPVTGLGFISAIAFSAITHAFIDRRWPVKKLLEMTGSPKFAALQTPINGMYLSDQSLHRLALGICSVLLALL